MIEKAQRSDIDILLPMYVNLYHENIPELSSTREEDYRKAILYDIENKDVCLVNDGKAMFVMVQKVDFCMNPKAYWEVERVYIHKPFRKSIILGIIHKYITKNFKGLILGNTWNSSDNHKTLDDRFKKLSTTRIIKG
jgi:hypothetical protein